MGTKEAPACSTGMVASGEDEGNRSLDRKGDGSMVGGGSLDESTCEVKDETDGRAEVAGEGRTALCFLLFALLPRPCLLGGVLSVRCGVHEFVFRWRHAIEHLQQSETLVFTLLHFLLVVLLHAWMDWWWDGVLELCLELCFGLR